MRLQLQALEWVKTRLGLINPFRARVLNDLSVYLRAVGRRQEALAPTEEAVKTYRELAKSNPAYLGDLAGSLNNLGYLQLQLGQPEMARSAYEESIAIVRPLAAGNPAFQDDLQRTLNNLQQLNRDEGIRSGATQVLGAGDLRYLPSNDPTTTVKPAVVRLWPTFSGNKSGIGLLGTGFVVRRQGDRAWIATALHVVRTPDGNSGATKVEAELFTGPLPPGLVPPRLELVLNPSQPLPDRGDELILLGVRGLPPDVQPLPLANIPAKGVLMIVGHPTGSDPWTVVRLALLKPAPTLVLDGRLSEGASGSPVLTPAGQVVGLVFRSRHWERERRWWCPFGVNACRSRAAALSPSPPPGLSPWSCASPCRLARGSRTCGRRARIGWCWICCPPPPGVLAPGGAELSVIPPVPGLTPQASGAAGLQVVFEPNIHLSEVQFTTQRQSLFDQSPLSFSTLRSGTLHLGRLEPLSLRADQFLRNEPPGIAVLTSLRAQQGHLAVEVVGETHQVRSGLSQQHSTTVLQGTLPSRHLSPAQINGFFGFLGGVISSLVITLFKGS